MITWSHTLYLLIGCYLVASGISAEERSEGRSGGCGVGSAENTGPVRCPAAESGYEGTHTLIQSHLRGTRI